MAPVLQCAGAMTVAERAQIVLEVAERVALWNEFRTADFRDQVLRLIASGRERWRVDGELPRHGQDRLLDALLAIADVADGSPMTVRDACAAALRAAEDATVTR